MSAKAMIASRTMMTMRPIIPCSNAAGAPRPAPQNRGRAEGITGSERQATQVGVIYICGKGFQPVTVWQTAHNAWTAAAGGCRDSRQTSNQVTQTNFRE